MFHVELRPLTPSPSKGEGRGEGNPPAILMFHVEHSTCHRPSRSAAACDRIRTASRSVRPAREPQCSTWNIPAAGRSNRGPARLAPHTLAFTKLRQKKGTGYFFAIVTSYALVTYDTQQSSLSPFSRADRLPAPAVLSAALRSDLGTRAAVDGGAFPSPDEAMPPARMTHGEFPTT